MTELREVFEMVTDQVEPDQDSWNEQERRQRRRARNQRIGAFAVVAAIVLALLTFVLLARPGGSSRPATRPIPVPVDTTPPMGAQVVGLDGTVKVQIPGLPEDAFGLALAPDGRTLAFRAYHDGGYQVATMRVDGTGLRFLTTDGSADTRQTEPYEVAWSPDGRRIAYSANHSLYVIDADGSHEVRLTLRRGPEGDWDPTWSPDGTRIAFWSGTGGGDAGPVDSEIYTIPAEGGVAPTRLTDDGVPDIEPAWSPDGTQIAYLHGGQLWVMRSDGSRAHRILSVPHGTFAPTWSPDGHRIAFLVSRGLRASIPTPALGEGAARDAPLLAVRILDLRSGKIRSVGVRVATNGNPVSWPPGNDGLVVNRWS